MSDQPMQHPEPLGDGPVGPPHSHVIETEVKGDLSLYDPKQERVLVLNGTATDIWLLCDGEQNVDAIIELIATAYGQPQSAIAGEVVATITQFIEEGFIPSP
jgi:hypothetical protein